MMIRSCWKKENCNIQENTYTPRFNHTANQKNGPTERSGKENELTKRISDRKSKRRYRGAFEDVRIFRVKHPNFPQIS